MFNQEKMGRGNLQEASPQQEKLQEGFDIQIKSLASEGHLDRNEDAMFMRKDKKIFGVLDGMGGHAAGDVASGEARNYIMQTLEKLPEGLSLQQTEVELERVLREANNQLLQLAEKNPNLRGMGTTASIVKIWEGARGERKAVIVNVGDSRVYIFRANGRLEQVTLDDNAVSSVIKNELQARVLQEKLNNTIDPNILSPQEKVFFNRRNEISQALGMRDIKARISTIDVRDGEKIIVTSDGIHDNLTNAEITQILTASENNQQAVENLINASRNRSREQHPRAKADDMSAMVVEFLSASGSKEVGRVPQSPIAQKPEAAQQQMELKELNPPEKKINISEAKDFTELFKAIEASRGFQGSKKFYEVAELKQIINQIRSGELPLDSVTRAGGLRQRVADLLKLE